ncbi:MAG: hypothetical protein O7A67_10310, partial [SAR324 cluster bacterium]|nr:hypothetical protein [SAR324 cluster bacterium]
RRGQGGAHLFHGKGFDDRFDLLHGGLYSSVQGLLEITDSHCPASHGRYRQRSPYRRIGTIPVDSRKRLI